MGEHETAGQPTETRRDPLLRFLAGCAVVAVVVLAFLFLCAWYVGWRLTQDPAPGRTVEGFLAGDETRYWCVNLRPDDQGMQALFRRVDAVGEETRRKALHGTFLESFPLPRRRAQLDRIAPLTLEGALVMSDPAEGPPSYVGWSARGTFSHDVLRMRAALRLMRWVMSRNPGKSAPIDVDGVLVTTVHDKHVAFALANVGNRVLAANDASRMRAVLAAPAEPPHAAAFALHREVTLDGEDMWAFLANTEIGDPPGALSIAVAAASFDVDADDALRFRIAVSTSAAIPEGHPFSGNREDCRVVAHAFLPMFDGEAIELDGDGAAKPAAGFRVFSGRIPSLSKQLPELPKRLGELIVRSTASAQETPSAIPTPPSPPSAGGRRSGTPAAPKREGTPKPPR